MNMLTHLAESIDAGDVAFVDTGCYSLNALLSGSIYMAVCNKYKNYT